MVGALGLASTDLRPSGTITIESEKFDAVAITGVIARGSTVEVVDRDDIRVTVRSADLKRQSD
ncbi:MAG: membrane-bound serine protease (ClpP class) [Akkermansiaceae bacterium]|jgi:membrane-bound serine protease (ClpP class)